jgi:predicted flap endonuclease-1-like 5' DNA nuclease
MAKLTTIEGIGPAYEEKLKGAGIDTCEELLEKGATKAGRAEIVEKSGIDASRILRFVNHADLCRIKGVGGEYAEILEAAGVDSVPELAQRNAANLAAKMEEVNAEKKLVRQVPSAKLVEGWVEQAKSLPRVVTH